MTDNYALVKDGKVINIVVWDGNQEVDFGEGLVPVVFPEGLRPGIGWTYEGGKFTAPPFTEEEKAAILQGIIDSNISYKAYLIAQATIAIAPLQDAVDLDEATAEETALLKKWKQYRVAVNRIDAETSDEITWPEQPA